MPLSMSQRLASMDKLLLERLGRFSAEAGAMGVRLCEGGHNIAPCEPTARAQGLSRPGSSRPRHGRSLWVRWAFALATSVASCGLQAGETWMGWVSWVMDGDTVLLVRDGQHEPVKLRLDGIDAPETCQPGGSEARDAMIRLALRKPVQVLDLGHDSYGRQLGRLSVDGVDLGAEMVRTGMAWAYRFRTGKGPYARLQHQAQKQKIGLFSASDDAMSPPVFRKFHGTCHGS